MKRILVIDDDQGLCELVAEYLELEGYEVEAAHDSESGVELALSGRHTLAVLDVMLAGASGFEVLRRIRACSRLPVVMLTARSEDVDRIVGLELGADDYLSKPFNPRELVARINAILRRLHSEEQTGRREPAKLSVDDVEVDTATRTIRRSGKVLEATVVEYDLLERLLRTPGHIVARKDLARDILHRDLSPFDRSIDVHICNLRRKLGQQISGAERIKTIRGVGFSYSPAGEAKERRA